MGKKGRGGGERKTGMVIPLVAGLKKVCLKAKIVDSLGKKYYKVHSWGL